MNQKISGIFPYDIFPYIISREIEEVKADGMVKDYQNYHYSSPLMILPTDVAQSLIKDADSLKANLDAEIDHSKKVFLSKLITRCTGLLKVVTYLGSHMKV